MKDLKWIINFREKISGKYLFGNNFFEKSIFGRSICASGNNHSIKTVFGKRSFEKSCIWENAREPDSCPCGSGKETAEHCLLECPHLPTGRPMDWSDVTEDHLHYMRRTVVKLWENKNLHFTLRNWSEEKWYGGAEEEEEETGEHMIRANADAPKRTRWLSLPLYKTPPPHVHIQNY